jgi:F-type H+-transporting ATPase subunit delta
MRGPSRISLADAKERMAALATRSADPGRIGDELFAVLDLLDTQLPLRRALADNSSAADARTGLVRAVLGSDVSPETVELVGEVATSQWSRPRDLVDAIEQLAVLAIVAGADQVGHLEDLEDELFRFGRIVAGQSRLRAALSNPFAPVEAKRDLVASLLDGRATGQTIQLVTQASEHARGRSLDRSLEDYARLAAEERQRLVAEVRVATELSAEQRRRLAAALATMYGHEVHLNLVLDPEVVGGMIIRIGGEQIDGSVVTRLADLRRNLVR